MGEVVLRVIGFGSIQPQLHFDVHTSTLVEAGHFVPHPRLFWQQADGPYAPLEKQWRIVHLDDPLPARSSRFRILCLGDSCTRLSGQNPPYSVLLEQELGSRRVEVFNASLPGYTSHQGLAWLELQLLDYEFDLVIVYFGWNDHWRSTGLNDRQYAAQLASHRPRLLQLFQRPEQPPPLRVALEEYAENLRLIIDRGAERGGETLLLTAPCHFTPENVARFLQNGNIIASDRPQVLHEQYLSIVRNLQGYRDTEVFDLARILAEINAPRMLLQRDGIHPTEVGHSVLATLLSDVVADRYLGLPGSPVHPVAVAQVLIANQLTSRQDWQGAVHRHREAVADAPDEPGPRLGLAWLLATIPDDEVRDGQEALALLDGVELDSSQVFQLLDIRAAAQAELGNFEVAASMMATALSQLEATASAPPAVVQAFRERQELFRRGEPYRLATAPRR